MKNIFNFLTKDDIGEPPWEYYFLQNLDKKEYPRYLAKLFKLNTGENLPLKYDFKLKNWVIDKNKCKTFNQKIQWIKLHGVTDLMRKCTDKVAVRDYVREVIGEQYLKPVLQIITSGEIYNCDVMPDTFAQLSNDEIIIELEKNKTLKQVQGDRNTEVLFDKIDFDKLPDSFVIKCNHGCKWQYIIKNKEKFLKNLQLYEYVKRQMTGWLEQEWFVWGGFELNYKGIKPKILIEKLLREEINTQSKTVQFYCFNGNIKFVIELFGNNQTCLYDEKLNIIDDILSCSDMKINIKAEEIIYNAYNLSK